MQLTHALCAFALAAAATAQSPCAILSDVYPGSTSSLARGLTPAFGGSLLFSAQDATGWGLFRTDGGGQVQLLMREPRPEEKLVECSTRQGSRVFFVGVDPTYGTELHCTDGTPGGTRMVKDIRPGGLGCAFGLFTPFGERMLFWCSDYSLGSEPFITDGTAAGTFRLKDVHPGRNHSTPRDFTPAGDYALFVANDGTTGLELYVTDGTQAGTMLLKDISSPTHGYPQDLTRFGDKVVFTAFTAAAGRELWISDGTTAGTLMLKDIYPGPSGSSSGGFVEMNGKVYFGAVDGSHGHELWVTDGTNAGTRMVKDLYPGNPGADVARLTVCNGKLYFSANQLGARAMPHVSDGTAAGTMSLKAPHQTYPPAGAQEFTAIAGNVLFRAGQLWVTDGTPAGTNMLFTAATGPFSPAVFTAVGNGACFRADGGTAGWELWFSDGTMAGTQRICDLNPGNANSNPDWLRTAGGRLFFTATTPSTGLEVFNLPNPGATVHSIHGASEPNQPVLRIADGATPVLGGSATIEAIGPAGHIGFLIAGPSTDHPLPPVPGLLMQGVDWVGALTPNSLIAAVTTTASLSLTLPVPNVPAADGQRANLQAWWIAPGPLRFQVSNGLQLRLGTGAPR